MAGWIKMRTGLWTHPKVALIAMRLGIPRAAVIGCLHGAWSIADEHSEDGTIAYLTTDMIDAQVEQPGFAQQMAAVGWLEITDTGVQFPRYEEHNGATAKRRASEQKRKRVERAAVHDPPPVRNPSASMRTKCGPEERRGEEKKKPPIVPQGTSGGVDETTNPKAPKPKRTRFSPPTLQEVTAYCAERRNGIQPQDFLDYYATRGWKLNNGVAMKDWRAAVRTWESRRRDDRHEASGPAEGGDDYVA